MTGKMVCLLTATAGLLVLLWLYARNQEKNKKDAAKVLVLAGSLGFVICMTESNSQRLLQDGRLQRNEAGGETESQELQLNVDGILKDYNYMLEVEAQRLQGKELEQLFAAAAEEAEKEFIGENLSLDCIDRTVLLPKSLQDGQIRAK